MSRSSSSSSKQSRKSNKENCKVYVSNIFKNAQEPEIKQLFGKYGEITYFVLKKKQNQVTYAFIEYRTHEMAKKAVDQMNKTNFCDRILNVQFGKGGKHQQKHYQSMSLNPPRPKYYEGRRGDQYNDQRHNKYPNQRRYNRDDDRYPRERRHSPSPKGYRQQREYRRDNSPRGEYKASRTQGRIKDEYSNVKKYDDSKRQDYKSSRHEYGKDSRDDRKHRYGDQGPKRVEKYYSKDHESQNRRQYPRYEQRDKRNDLYQRYPKQRKQSRYIRQQPKYDRRDDKYIRPDDRRYSPHKYQQHYKRSRSRQQRRQYSPHLNHSISPNYQTRNSQKYNKYPKKDTRYIQDRKISKQKDPYRKGSKNDRQSSQQKRDYYKRKFSSDKDSVKNQVKPQ